MEKSGQLNSNKNNVQNSTLSTEEVVKQKNSVKDIYREDITQRANESINQQTSVDNLPQYNNVDNEDATINATENKTYFSDIDKEHLDKELDTENKETEYDYNDDDAQYFYNHYSDADTEETDDMIENLDNDSITQIDDDEFVPENEKVDNEPHTNNLQDTSVIQDFNEQNVQKEKETQQNTISEPQQKVKLQISEEPKELAQNNANIFKDKTPEQKVQVNKTAINSTPSKTQKPIPKLPPRIPKLPPKRKV